MNRIALLISAVATVAGVVLLRVYMQRFEEETRGGTASRVLVLTQDVAAGSVLRREMLGTRDLPPASLESRHVLGRDIDQVLDARLGVAARANEALLWTDLASMREPARQLSKLVPEGMRGLTLALSSGAYDSLIEPGDRVDVLMIPHADGEAPATGASVAAENVLVLAVGNDLGGNQQERESRMRSGQVTLSVAPDQGARLAQAERLGSLRLTVRNPDDIEVTGRAEASLGATQARRTSTLQGSR